MANFSFVSHLAVFEVFTINNSWKYVHRCMVRMTVRRGGSWRFPISFGTRVGNLQLWMSVSSYFSIRNPKFWQGYCVCMWMICCWVAVAQHIVKQSMHSVHVSSSANGKEIKENSVVAAFLRMFSPKRSQSTYALKINKVTVRARAQPEGGSEESSGV